MRLENSGSVRALLEFLLGFSIFLLRVILAIGAVDPTLAIRGVSRVEDNLFDAEITILFVL